MKRAALALLLLAGCRRDDPPAHLQRAKDAVFAKKPDVALGEYRLALDALERDPSPEATVYRARALRGAADVYYLELHDYKRAVGVYRELITLCPEAPETLAGRLHLADILRREFRDLRGAIAELTAALARNPPQSAELSYDVARLYFELGDYQQAELEAAGVARKFETSPLVDDALFLRGQALAMMEGHKAEAQRVFANLAERLPDSELQPHALFELGKLKAEAGERDGAIEVWVAALKRHPDPQVVQAVIGRVRRQVRSTTPRAVGDAAKAFDRDVPGSFVGPSKPPKTSIEAVGGSEAEAAKEAAMKAEPVPELPLSKE